MTADWHFPEWWAGANTTRINALGFDRWAFYAKHAASQYPTVSVAAGDYLDALGMSLKFAHDSGNGALRTMLLSLGSYMRLIGEDTHVIDMKPGDLLALMVLVTCYYSGAPVQ